MSNLKDQIDEECQDCGKSKKEAEEIVPVMAYGLGPQSLTGEWSCGNCADKLEKR